MAEFIRQQSLLKQDKLSELRIAIVGCGAIGSFTALSLTKMGAQHLALWDKDSVELHNISNQFFTRESIEMPKVLAVSEECRRYTPVYIDIDARHEVFSEQSLSNFDVVIALTDNIEGRRAAFQKAVESPRTMLFIDGRMGAETFRAFAFNPKMKEKAEKYYNEYIDGVANQELPCTARSIIYNVQLAASILTSFVKKFVNGEPMPFQLIFNFQDYSLMKDMGV